ncbi:BTAD domain-containing putative transcriptional regulator [Alkalihalobacterium elongatum]|uniref:BTAD domain-containing putative transcriptional regulator n=1 Tax=Alkalihalobacterium elongatum TaxID=2675466 RepID=UPI001C1FB47F|nr:BTAD domain-containing putative transcriptional regulator [Alkalihalobacterium elongatum]
MFKNRIPVVQTKFTPPILKETNISRLHLMKKMRAMDNNRLTLVHSGPGYGKSTSIAAYLNNQSKPYCWYSITKDEDHIHPFIIHMIYSIQQKYSHFGLRLLEYLMTESVLNIEDQIEYLASEYVNELLGIREECILVIDDFHLVETTKPIERWLLFIIKHLPKHVHLIISSRVRPTWDIFTKMIVHGDLVEITENELAFSKDEVEVLFSDFYQIPITEHELEQIYNKTEGWIIAIQMVWQQMKLDSYIRENEWEAQTNEEFFRYLALEVFSKQPIRIKEFLLKTSIVEDLHPVLLEEVVGIQNSRDLLSVLIKQNLLIYQVGQEQYRYHALFRDFLLQQLQENSSLFNSLHNKLAQYYKGNGDYEKSMYHFAEIKNYEQVAKLIQAQGLDLLAQGKIELLSNFIDCLPEVLKTKFALIWFIEGEINRYFCCYEKALSNYNQLIDIAVAKGDLICESLGNEGKAKIFLDTIQPAKADNYLARAIELMEKSDKKEVRILHLYSLMAENLVNLGKAFEAEKWLYKCKQLDPRYEKEELESRLYLRTGRLEQARELLEKSKERNDITNDLSRSHRETDLILSIVYSYMGEAERSKRLAEQGILRGTSRKAPFVEACGWIRMGHAVQIQKRYKPELAVHCYETALELMDQLNMSRGKSEAYLGLCLLYGKIGDYQASRNAGELALEEPNRVKDIWLSSYIHLALGIAAFYEKNDRVADEELLASYEGFKQCGCLFGETASLFWLSRFAFSSQDQVKFISFMNKFLNSIKDSQYDFLLTASTLYGPKDVEEAIPMFLEAKKQSVRIEQTTSLLNKLGYEQISFHPGYTVKVQLFGDFQVWLGDKKVNDKAWKREKAKELLQLFLTKKGRMLSKTELISHLWADVDEEAANRDFKVALNALNKVLEPNRKPREVPFFITREGSMYGLNEEASFDIDCYVFQEHVQQGIEEKDLFIAKDKLMRGLELFIDEFLPSRKYNDWCSDERERFSSLYLRGSEKLAQLFVGDEQFDDAITLCDAILKVDRCWEEAYRLLMYSYYRKHNRPYALRVFEKCKKNLEQELGVEPMESTLRMLEVIKEPDNIDTVV